MDYSNFEMPDKYMVVIDKVSDYNPELAVEIYKIIASLIINQ